MNQDERLLCAQDQWLCFVLFLPCLLVQKLSQSNSILEGSDSWEAKFVLSPELELSTRKFSPQCMLMLNVPLSLSLGLGRVGVGVGVGTVSHSHKLRFRFRFRFRSCWCWCSR